MILYLVKSAMPYFVAKQDAAKRDARQLKCNWEQVEVPTADGREALAAFLNTLGGPATITVVNPMEGEPVTEEVVELLPKGGYDQGYLEATASTLSHTHQQVAFEDQFEKMPLAQKLHFAALAMEAAREAIG